MDLDEKQITNLVSDKETELMELRTQMNEDFELFSLGEYSAEEGYESYTTSQPRNFFDKVVDAVNRAEITIQIEAPEDAKQEERDAASLGELYLFGALNAIDRNLRQKSEPPLRESLAFLSSLRGWIVMRALVYVLDGETVFDVLPWDILHTTWESGSKGLLWIANKRKLSKAQILSEWGVEIKNKDAELIDFFDTENNSVIIGGKFAKEPTEHGLDHVPSFIGSVGTMPTIQTSSFASTIKHRGDSVWAASRNLYEPFNKITSRTMDLYERAVVASVIHKSKRGDKSIPGDPYKTYQEVKISTDDDEEIIPFPAPEVPTETAILHSIINTDIQTSTLPYPLAYGGTRQAMSGAALSVLSDATRSVYSPRCSLLAQGYTWLCEELLLQYKQNGVKATMKGYDDKKHFFTVKVKPKQIDPSWYVSVDVSPRMPRDMESEIMMSLAATSSKGQGDIPLMSKRTAREDIIKIRDPDSEVNRIFEEMGESLPPIMATQVAVALKKAGKEDLARDVMMLLNPQGAQQRQPQIPPELMMAALEGLMASGIPELQQLAQKITQALGGQKQAAGAQAQPPVQPTQPGTPQGVPV